jgi:hypothetical protein
MKEADCFGCQHLKENHWCVWHNCEACAVPKCPAVENDKEEEEE